MVDRAGQDVCNGLDAAMGMPGKPGQIIGRPVVAEIVEQQKGSVSAVSPKPNARRNLTPAPSMVGCDCTMRLTGRIDMDSATFRLAQCAS